MQICFEKFALASAIDAFCRKQIEINEMKEKNKIAERILSISLIKMIRIQLFMYYRRNNSIKARWFSFKWAGCTLQNV